MNYCFTHSDAVINDWQGCPVAEDEMKEEVKPSISYQMGLAIQYVYMCCF